MDRYLIILKKKNDYYDNEYEELWLPTTTEQIEFVLHRLGCRLILPDYEIVYTNFGCPVIDQLAFKDDVLALNRLAELLVDITDSPTKLSAELLFAECKDIYDVLAHLYNRPPLIVWESVTNIADYGMICLQQDFYGSSRPRYQTYEEYEREMFFEHGCSLDKLYIKLAIENLRCRKFRFTEYGLVFEDLENMLPF